MTDVAVSLLPVLICLMVLMVITIGSGGSNRPGWIEKRRNRKECKHYHQEGTNRYMRCLACGQRFRINQERGAA